MGKQFYITTPLYYVNDEPHIGHAYTTILADVLARYHRIFGDQVHFLTGLDEHGQKVANAAAKHGRKPQDHCDKMAKIWQNVWDSIGISFDDFIRTTEPRHERIVLDILNKIHEKGEIYQEEYEGWYSIFEERFFTEKDLVNGKDPISGRPVERIKEKNYFFRMSQYQDWLIDHYTNNPDAVVPRFRLNEVLGFLRQPLGDLCISRPKSRLTWGIPIPWDEDYVTYVWFDALINYYTAILYPPAGSVVNWPAQYHLIGKDILTTHAVYWPIMLHAAGLKPPEKILAHGWWLTKDDVRMAKSSGNFVKPFDLAEKYGAEAFRYVMIREMVVGQDASFSEETFVNRINSDLANDLGNLYSRLAKLWHTGKYGSVLPLEQAPDEIPVELLHARERLNDQVRHQIEEVKPHAAIEVVFNMVRGLNQLIEQLKPWELVKNDPPAIRDALLWALESLEEVSRLLKPVMPQKMSDLGSWIKDESGAINPQVGKMLFPRIKEIKPQESEKDVEWDKSPELDSDLSAGIITIDEFARMDLRVGIVKQAESVKGSDNLLVIQVDIGTETRQIIAGIAKHYSPDDMIGKRIAVVVNLKQAKIRGNVSHGMLLAAESEGDLAIVTLDKDLPPGAKIH